MQELFSALSEELVARSRNGDSTGLDLSSGLLAVRVVGRDLQALLADQLASDDSPSRRLRRNLQGIDDPTSGNSTTLQYDLSG